MRYVQKKKRGKLQIDQIDIREMLDDLGIPYRESGNNVGQGWIGVCCPFCGDTNYHLGINLLKKTITCFKCPTTGTIVKFIAEELNSFEKALSVIEQYIPKELREFSEQIKTRSVIVKLPSEASRKITPYHAGYLHSRGFDYAEMSDKYNLHYCGPIGDWRNRIIVPIVKSYRILTFTSIDISDDSSMRYRHLSEEESIIHAKELLYGIEFTKRVCCIVEGLFDYYRIGDGALCTFGVKLSPEQIKQLTKFRKVMIAFDGDDPGKKNAEIIAHNIAAFTDVEILYLPDFKDPDTLNEDDINFIKRKLGSM